MRSLSFTVQLFLRYSPPSPPKNSPKQTLYFRSLRRSISVVTAIMDQNLTKNTSLQPEHVAGPWYSVPELRLRDHHFIVPLDYSLSQSPKISIFAREAVAVGKEEEALPYLLFLQGGPGYESPRPTESNNIVNDAEFIRKHLVPDAGPWKLLGQSFGGFCGVTYLSFAPQGLKQVFLTGGIPSIKDGCTAETVYNACIDPIVLQNQKYYKRYPQDVEIIRDVVNYLTESEGGGVPLPSGGILTPRGLQLLGLTGLGASTGFERLHYLFERVWDPVIVPGSKKQISYYFLNSFEKWLSFDTNPLYALMHESIYCQGAASQWAAHRVRLEHENKLDAVKAAKEGRPVFFTGEMVFPWMFDEIHALRPFKEAANLLAEKKDWPPLYNKTALNNNKVPVAAAVYYEDMFVNFKLAMETAKEIAGIRLWVTNEYMHSGLRDGAGHVPVATAVYYEDMFVNFKLAMETAKEIAGIRLWVTNEYMHSGLRDGAGHVFDHLMGLLNGKKPLF
ncbi:hypothetical protein LXL04_010738 [Taraxacum kok-saghyz]